MRFPRITIAAALAVCAIAAAAAAEVVEIDGVPHVRNGATPANGETTLALRELWRVGGADDEENFFGLVVGVDSDAAGNVYLLDGQLCQVSVYSPDGELLKTLFREGDGPGEVRQPRDLVLMPDGRVGLVQEFPGKVVFVDAAGDPAGSLTAGAQDPSSGGFSAINAADCRGGTLLMSGVDIVTDGGGAQERTLHVSSYAQDGALKARLTESHASWNFNDFVFRESENLPGFLFAQAIGPDGRIYIAPSAEDYAIRIYDADGDLQMIIEREHEIWKRTAEQTAFFRRLIEGALRVLPVPYGVEPRPYEPVVAWMQLGLQVTDSGELWVCTSRGLNEKPDDVMLSYDVFDARGRFDRVAHVAYAADGREDGLFLLGEDRAVVIKGFADAVSASFGGTTELEEGEESEPMGIIYCEIVR